MLVLLPIEVDNDWDVDKLRVKYKLYNMDDDSGCIQMEKNRKLLIMPEYRGEPQRCRSTVLTWHEIGFVEGFNTCIDFIKDRSK